MLKLAKEVKSKDNPVWTTHSRDYSRPQTTVQRKYQQKSKKTEAKVGRYCCCDPRTLGLSLKVAMYKTIIRPTMANKRKMANALSGTPINLDKLTQTPDNPVF